MALPPIGDIVRKAKSPFQEYGVGLGFFYLLHRTLQKIDPRLALRVYVLMCQPIPTRTLLPERMRRVIEVRQITSQSPELGLMPVRPDVMSMRLMQQCECFGAFRGGELIGYVWFAFDRYLEDEVRCVFEVQPASSTTFDFDLFIFPKHRMGLAFVGIWDGAGRELRQRGIEYTFSRVSMFNIASRRAHARLGAVVLGRTLFLQLGTLEIMMGTVEPYLHLSWKREDRVTIRLTPRTSGIEPIVDANS